MIIEALPNMLMIFRTMCCPTNAAIVDTATKYKAVYEVSKQWFNIYIITPKAKQWVQLPLAHHKELENVSGDNTVSQTWRPKMS